MPAAWSWRSSPTHNWSRVKPTGQGNVTKTHIAWKVEDGGPDICSPVSDGTYVYLLDSEGLLTCCNVEDGKKVYEQELEGAMSGPRRASWATSSTSWT